MVSKSKSVRANDIVFNGVMSVIEKTGMWQGTMTSLNQEITKRMGKRQAAVLPGSPSALRVAVNSVIHRIRNQGVQVRFGRTTDHKRTRFVMFSRTH